MAGKVVTERELAMAPAKMGGGAASLGKMHPVKAVTAELDEEAVALIPTPTPASELALST